jgi:leader peptidase (prepilin peptidase)/N-methyltransferase
VELIPVVSYLLQRGRCRYCGAKISPRYPIIEGLTGLLFVALVAVHFFTPLTLPYLVLGTVALVVAAIDFDLGIIPNRLLAFAAVMFVPLFLWLRFITWQTALVGAAVGGGVLFTLRFLSRGGMGWGDVKYGLVFGLYLGPWLTLFTLLVGFVTGAVAGIGLLLSKTKRLRDKVPFGPFLSIGVISAMLVGPRVIQWYVGAFLP